MKRLNQTESPIFVILSVLFFQTQSFCTFVQQIAASAILNVAPVASHNINAMVVLVATAVKNKLPRENLIDNARYIVCQSRGHEIGTKTLVVLF